MGSVCAGAADLEKAKTVDFEKHPAGRSAQGRHKVKGSMDPMFGGRFVFPGARNPEKVRRQKKIKNLHFSGGGGQGGREENCPKRFFQGVVGKGAGRKIVQNAFFMGNVMTIQF